MKRLGEIVNALLVKCPVCGAGVAVACKRPRSRKGTHKERIKLGTEKAKEDENLAHNPNGS